jgi:hypothetical protein
MHAISLLLATTVLASSPSTTPAANPPAGCPHQAAAGSASAPTAVAVDAAKPPDGAPDGGHAGHAGHAGHVGHEGHGFGAQPAAPDAHAGHSGHSGRSERSEHGAAPASPYTHHVGRDIKALAPSEVEELLAGRGMGLALAAELNGFPGPKHVLELAAELALSPAQRREVEAVFAAMQAEAARLGARIVEGERELDRAFATAAVTESSLRASLDALAAWRAELRYVHLRAHLATRALLTPEQVAGYVRERGYDAPATAGAR